MKRIITVAVSVWATASFSEVVNPAPDKTLLDVGSVGSLQKAVDDSGVGSLTLGNGMLKWTGSGTSAWSGPLAFNAVSNLEVTVNVTDANATLKVAGATSETTPTVFLKTGPGTLELNGGGTLGNNGGTYPSLAGYWKTYFNSFGGYAAWEPRDPVWDARGIASNGGYEAFAVDAGTLRLNAPGKTFTLGKMPWVGTRSQTDSLLEITNGTQVVTVTAAGYMTIGRGTGTTANNATPVVRVVDKARLTHSGSLSLGNANGVSSFQSRARLEVDNAAVEIQGNNIYVSESANASSSTGAKIVVKNSGLLDHVATAPSGTEGFRILQASSSLEIFSCSTVRTDQVMLENDTSRLVITNGTLCANRSVPNRLYNNVRRGKLYFDQATLAPRDSDRISEWFGTSVYQAGWQYSMYIGANGLVLDTDGLSYLHAPLTSAETGAKTVKRGSGEAHVTRSIFKKMPTEVQAGTMGFTEPINYCTNDYTQPITLANKTALTVSGEGALGGSSITAAGDVTMNFLGGGKVVEATASYWSEVWARPEGDAVRHPDGLLQLTHANGAQSYGAGWQTHKVNVGESFTASFDYFANCSADPAFGWLLCLQAGDTTKIGDSNGGFGYTGGSLKSVKSFAMGVQVRDCQIMIGSNNALDKNFSMMGSNYSQIAADYKRPCRCVFTYDATTGKARFEIHVPAANRTYVRETSVNLATALGVTEAVIGFTAGSTNDRITEHCIRNFACTPTAFVASQPAKVRNGGNLTLASGATLTANLAGNEAVSDFTLSSLTLAGGAAKLAINNRGTVRAESARTLSIADPSLWTLKGQAYYKESDVIALCVPSGKSPSGSFYSKATYPVAGGDWKIQYTWRRGSIYKNTADQLTFNLTPDSQITSSPTWGHLTGISMDMLLFKSGAVVSRLAFRTNNVAVAALTRNALADGMSFQSEEPIVFTFDYSDTQKKLTFSYAQAGKIDSTTIDFDADKVFKGQREAYCSFGYYGGGYSCENLMSGFSWTGDAVSSALASARLRRPALGFDRMDGMTAIEKSGDADLAFAKPENLALPVTVREGGLRLSKENLTKVTIGAAGGWAFRDRHASETGYYTLSNGVRIGTGVSSNQDTVQLRHRVRTAGKWRAKWTMSNLKGANDFSFFWHGDPAGDGLTTGGLGYGLTCRKGRGIKFTNWGTTYTGGSVALAWTKDADGRHTAGTATDLVENGISLTNSAPIDVVLTVDTVADTVEVKLTQGAKTFTKTWTSAYASQGANFRPDDETHLGFCTGGGGVHTYPRFDNFSWEILDYAEDPSATTAYAHSVAFTGTRNNVTLAPPFAGANFKLAKTVTVGTTTVLDVGTTGSAATLTADVLQLASDVVLSGDTTATIAPSAVLDAAGAAVPETITVDGVVFALPPDQDFSSTRFVLTNGARLKTEKCVPVRSVTVDGVRQRGVVTSADWIVGAGVWIGRGFTLIVR